MFVAVPAYRESGESIRPAIGPVEAWSHEVVEPDCLMCRGAIAVSSGVDVSGCVRVSKVSPRLFDIIERTYLFPPERAKAHSSWLEEKLAR